MKHITYSFYILATLISFTVMGQDEQEDENALEPTRPHFESAWLIDNQSVVIPRHKTLEFMIQHRFGTLENDIEDLYGLYAPSNIRLGLSYTLFDNFGFGFLKGPLSIGAGTTKNNHILDLNYKYGLMQQTRNGQIPFSVTYFGNVALEAERLEENGNDSDRYSYFHQLIISRRFSYKLSLQIAPSVSHYNLVIPEMNNDHFAVAIGGRYKFSAQSSVIFNVDQPITAHKARNPHPNVSLGIEIATSAHAFQVFFTNYNAILPQKNNFSNNNSPWVNGKFKSGLSAEGFLIGFNINRLWAF